MTTISKRLAYDKVINAIRNELASVLSRIDAKERYRYEGTLCVALLLQDAEGALEAEETELDALYEKILGPGGIVETLQQLDPPDENVENAPT